jgi:carboxypeptidase D
MVGFDVPQVSHDMILRFMGVDFNALAGGTAHIPSTLGDDVKPTFDVPTKEGDVVVPPADTPKDDKALWEGRPHRLDRFSSY